MNKVAVVTASSRGIGAATALTFGKNGYDVVINYVHNKEAAQEVSKAIEAAGSRALVVQADVFTEQGVRQLFEATAKQFGTIDVLINNAGRPAEPSFGEWTQETVAASLTANVISAALCTQAAVPLMNDDSSILFTSSIYGLQFGGNPTLPLYSAGKAAIVNLAQTMAEKLAPRIRCNVVAPGFTKTPAWDSAGPAYVQESLDMTMQKEWVAAEEIAASFLYLANTPHINAQTIVVDAGWQKKIRGKHLERSA